jgi:putative nucleotidyltransferase with HDIG domain
MTYKIMIVDDEPANLRLLERLFRRKYTVITANSGMEALRLLEQHDVALIITDQRMPHMTGIELLKQTADLRPHMVRIILTGYTDVEALVEAINCGQVYKYVTKPWVNEDLQLTVSRAIEHFETNKSRHELEHINQRLSLHLKELSQGFVRAITDALEAKDEYVHGHARRVSGYGVAIGRRMGLDDSLVEQISLAGLLHDIGKIGTPDNILLKPSPLTEEEHAIMRLHSERGARMLASVPEMQDVADAVRYHHENFDGTGYPEALFGEQIPIAARIISVADAYDAMTSPRPFREACDHEAAFDEIQNCVGTKFDPEVVQAFSSLEAIPQIRRSIVSGSACLRPFAASISIELEGAPLSELIRTVEADPVLAADALRAANAGTSADSATTNIQAACLSLGDARTRAMVMRSQGQAESNALPEAFLDHALRCGTAARLIAERTGIVDPEDAYTLGLLHDIGAMLLCKLFPAEMKEIMKLEEDERCEREVAEFGVDHAQVSQWVLESCGVSRVLTAAVQTHHDVMRINAPSALLLHVANAIAHADEPQRDAALDTFGSDRLALLGLSRVVLASIYTSTAAAIEQQLVAFA